MAVRQARSGARAQDRSYVLLLWPTEENAGRTRRIWVDRPSHRVDFNLLVRMEERCTAKDYFFVPSSDVAIVFRERSPRRSRTSWLASDAAAPSRHLEQMMTCTQRGLALG